MRGPYQDLTTPFTHTDTRHECGEKFKKSETLKSGKKIILDVFDDPWAAGPRTIAVHADNDPDYKNHGSCLDKLTDTSWADFRYFSCDACGRLVARQCNYNGWRSYVHSTEDGEICIACYQEDILTNGHDETALKGPGVPGDFFSTGEPEDRGWTRELEGVFVNGGKSAADFLVRINNYKARGSKVLINYSTVAYGGSEGYVDRYTKGNDA
jgi:hypothetical protein